MEQIPSNLPVMDESKPGPAGWFQTWMKAVTKPNEQTFIEITESPSANNRTTFIWVFIAGTISGILQAILRTIYIATGIGPQLSSIPGFEQFTPPPSTGSDGGSIAIALVVSLCASPLAGLLSMLFFAIFAAIVQWIAKMFGGVGDFEKMAHAFAAITVPFTIVSGVLSLFSAIPFVGTCFGIISLGLAIYAFVLQAMAVKGVNRFGWGPAIGSLLIPVLVILVSCCCVVFAGFAVLGPVIRDTFNGLQFAP
jgi:hypothetical protein